MSYGRRQGLTLIELLIVTVLITILASIALARFDFTRKRGYRVVLRSDVRALAPLQEDFWYANRRYASTVGDLGFQGSKDVTITIRQADMSGWAATGEHAGLPGERCGFFYGSAPPAAAEPATREGVVRCSF